MATTLRAGASTGVVVMRTLNVAVRPAAPGVSDESDPSKALAAAAPVRSRSGYGADPAGFAGSSRIVDGRERKPMYGSRPSSATPARPAGYVVGLWSCAI